MTSKETTVPINKNKYTGNNRICSIKFNGKIEEPNVTLPFANPVKIKYQSVQGVTSNIIKPICKSIAPGKNICDNTNANSGVQTKFIMNADSEKRTFINDFESNFISMLKNTKNNITIRKISIKFPAYCSKYGLNFPIITPRKAEKMINTGCNFDKTLISKSILQLI
jgi:hypothetical protein